jgi:hypothetical protein
VKSVLGSDELAAQTDQRVAGNERRGRVVGYTVVSTFLLMVVSSSARPYADGPIQESR